MNKKNTIHNLALAWIVSAIVTQGMMYCMPMDWSGLIIGPVSTTIAVIAVMMLTPES